MDKLEMQVLYNECRDKGYTHSEAISRCKAFESRCRPERKPRYPYDFADVVDSLPHERRDIQTEARHRDFEFTSRPTHQSTAQRPTYQTTERQPRHADHMYDEFRRTEHKASSRDNVYRGDKYQAPRYVDGDDDEDTYFREEYRSTRTSHFKTQTYYTKYTEPQSSQDGFYSVETRSSRTPMSGAQSFFPGSPPLHRKYFTEERRPRKPSSRMYQYHQHHETLHSPIHTQGDRQDQHCYNDAQTPRPSRMHRDAPRHKTTEHKPRDIPRGHASGRESPPLRTTRKAPRSQYAYSYPHAHAKSHRAQSPSSPPPPPPPPTGYKPTVDLYSILGVSKAAAPDEIKKAHRKLSMKWHPDRCTDADKDMATEKMAGINQANDVLSDVDKRRFYDRTGCIPGSLDEV